MKMSPNSFIRLAIVLVGLMILTAGCSDNDVAAPQAGSDFTAEDPFDDALKSLDGNPPVAPGERLARLADYLGLDDDQPASLASAYSEFRDGMAVLRDQVASGELSREAAREQAAALRDAFEAELQIILTEEQWNMLQEMRDAGRRGERHHGGGHHDHNPGDLWGSWFEELGLDEAQVTDIIAAMGDLHAGMQDIRVGLHEGSMTFEDARAAAEELREEFDAALQSILTEEQYQALLDLRSDCGGPRHR